MKKLICLLIMFALMACSVSSLAEEWKCSKCANTATGNFCSNCGTPKPITEIVELPSYIGETFTEKGITYGLLDNGTVQIMKYNGSDATVTIPSKVKDYPVVGVGEAAFKDNTTLEGLINWAEFEFIGDYAFSGCTSLKTITIPSKTETIGVSAFEDCTSLETVIMWAKLKVIPEFAFKNCTKLESFSISSDTTTIGESAFEGCTNLNTAIFWGGETIGKSAFKNCTSLESISLPSSITLIEEAAFQGCTKLDSIIMWNKDAVVQKNAFLNCPYSNKDSIKGYIETEEDSNETEQASLPMVIKTPEPIAETATKEVATNGIRSEIKEALDSYEKFFDEYCAFMKKYSENPSDLSLIMSFATYMGQYADTMSKLDALDDGTLSKAELKYYLEVTSRITQKLVDVSDL